MPLGVSLTVDWIDIDCGRKSTERRTLLDGVDGQRQFIGRGGGEARMSNRGYLYLD